MNAEKPVYNHDAITTFKIIILCSRYDEAKTNNLEPWALPDLFGSSSLYNLPIYVYSSLFSRSLGHPPSLDLHSSLLSSLLPLLSLYFSVCSLLVFFLVQRVPLPPIFALRTLNSSPLDSVTSNVFLQLERICKMCTF